MSAKVLDLDNLKYQLHDVANGIQLDKEKLSRAKSKVVANDLYLKQIEAVLLLNQMFNGKD